MSRDQRFLLEDIADAYTKIADWTRNPAYDDFIDHGMVYSATLRELLVIGEAVKQVDPEVRARAPELPWREWAGLRAIVVHQYFGLQDATLWQVVREEGPLLLAAMDRLRAAHS